MPGAVLVPQFLEGVMKLHFFKGAQAQVSSSSVHAGADLAFVLCWQERCPARTLWSFVFCRREAQLPGPVSSEGLLFLWPGGSKSSSCSCSGAGGKRTLQPCQNPPFSARRG